MDRGEYTRKLLEAHKKLMNSIEMDTPTVTLRTKFLRTEQIGFQNTLVFEVASSSNKLKLSKVIDTKLYIKTKNPVTGTVIGTEENTLSVVAPRTLGKIAPGATVELVLDANYNNKKLLEKAEEFIKSGKRIPESLYTQLIEAPEIKEKKIRFFNRHLNGSQRLAVQYALSETPFKILGPPGTGKTETVVEMISQLLNSGLSVLVCGPSNTSVDNIILRFQTSPYNTHSNTPFYRLGSSSKGLTHLNLDSLAENSVSFMKKEKLNLKNLTEKREFIADKTARKKEFIRNLKSSEKKLVFATLFSSLKENFYFDVCIVDEACQATELECFMGVVKAKRFILAGDPHQLSGASSSLYEKVKIPTILLNEQYRMPESLIKFSNSYFYENEVISNRNDDFLFFEKSNILFIDTSYCGYSEKMVGSSKINEEEGNLIVEVVKWIHERVGGGCSVGVIVPYSAQVLFLRERLGDLSVDTVDGFQGQERDFIVLGLVRSNSAGEIGFLSDKRRLNVAITRARRGFVVVSDASNFRKNEFFSGFFEHLEEFGCVVDPESFRMMRE